MPTIIKHRTTAQIVLPFCYSLGCYLISLVSLIYFIVFSSGMYAPISINATPSNIIASEHTFITSFLINISLIAFFGLQHSIMARNRFKIWLSTFLPASVERATFCLGSSIALAMIAYFWAPMNGNVWSISGHALSLLIQIIGFAGWGLMLIATFQLDHFELFGLKQTFFPFIGKAMPEAKFKKPGLYKVVRHPIQLGVLIGVWFIPESTANHMMLATGMTIYIFIGLYFEEKELVKEFGKTYQEYKKQVAKLIPFLG